MSNSSNTKFWITRIVAMLVVVVSSYLLLNYNPKAKDNETVDKRSASQRMEDNVSSFYAEFRASSKDPIKEKFGEYVVPLESPDVSLENQILGLDTPRFNSQGSWQGEFKQRAFAQGSTLFAEAQTHILDNGMNLVWALNQDFIIRHRFVSENSLAGMLNDIATAIDANFVNTVRVYYCPVKQALVITDQEDEYLENQCELFE